MYFDNYNFDMNYFNIDTEGELNQKFDNNSISDMYMMNNETKIDLKNGFYLGNLFIDLYKPYKNINPKKINAYSEREKMLLKIYELDFILNDLNLYLDINPKDKKIFDIFKTTALELNRLKDDYYKKYQVLDLCKDTFNSYTWLDNPWTWEDGANV